MEDRKKLKEEYKKKKFQMGVFQIRNTITNRIFIDSSVDMVSKWNRHKTELNFGNHRNNMLLKEWKKYGENNFTFEILSVLKKKENEEDYREELKLLQGMITEELISRDFY